MWNDFQRIYFSSALRRSFAGPALHHLASSKWHANKFLLLMKPIKSAFFVRSAFDSSSRDFDHGKNAFHFDCALKKGNRKFIFISFNKLFFQSAFASLFFLLCEFHSCDIIHSAQIIMTEPIITSAEERHKKCFEGAKGRWSKWQKIWLPFRPFPQRFNFSDSLTGRELTTFERLALSLSFSNRLITRKVICTRCLIKIISSHDAPNGETAAPVQAGVTREGSPLQ